MLEAMWHVSLSLAPWLLLGAVLSGVLHAALPPDFLARHLHGKQGVVKAVLFGIPLPLCSCGVIPAGLGLRRDGASSGSAVGFVIATPQTGIDSVLVSASMLGLPFALFKVFAALVTGIVGGVATDAWAPGSGTFTPSAGATHASAEPRLRRALDHGLMVLRSIWRWLLVGVAISAALEVWVPANVWVTVSAWGSSVAVLAALAISVPLYVCATASVPIAASLVAGGLPAGAALVFLMAGPATNIATIGAIRSALGTRATTIYLATVVLGSVALGLAFDALWTTPLQVTAHVHDHPGLLTTGLSVLFWGMLALFALADLREFWQRRGVSAGQAVPGATGGESDDEASGNGAIDVQVEGLTCQGCVRKLERTLTSDEQVAKAHVTLDPQRATVVGQVNRERIKELVEQAGYRVVA